MAHRPVFTPLSQPPFFEDTEVEFHFYPGFAMVQKRRNIEALQQGFLREHPDARILEISTKSPEPLGVALSPFNLRISHGDETFFVESAFQSSKRFEHLGPHPELLRAPAREARRELRAKEAGPTTGYEYFGESFPTVPPTYFYNWLYITALTQNPDLSGQLLSYNAFTDIENSPARSTNCQARAAATVVGLSDAGLLAQALSSKEAFLTTVYPTSPKESA